MYLHCSNQIGQYLKSVIRIAADVNNFVDPKLKYKCFTFSEVLQPLLLDFSLIVKAAPHECVIRTSQP